MAQGNRANENDAKATGYELGDLEIVRTGRASGERPVVQSPAQAPASPPQASAATAKPAARGIPRNLTLADGDMGPALELDMGPTAEAPRAAPPVAKPPARAPGVPPPPPNASHPAAAVASFGESGRLDDDFDQGGFAKLPSLDVEKVERRSAERVVAREAAPEAPQVKENEELLAVQTLARFNETPSGWIASVPYAFHVATRLFALRKERAHALEAERARHGEQRAAMAALGQALVQKAAEKRMEPLRAKVALAREERAKVERADASAEKTREGNERALGVLRSEAEHLKEQLAPYVAAEKEAEAARRKADEEVRRAQAMLKRVEIEMRALDEAATAPDPARMDTLQAQQEQRSGVVNALSASLAQATEALGKARRELAMSRGALDANEEKQKRMESEARAREAEAQGQQQAANGAYENALCELADAARQQRIDTLTPEQAGKVKSSQDALEEATVTLARFDRALVLYDRPAVIRGAGLVLSLVAALIALLVLK